MQPLMSKVLSGYEIVHIRNRALSPLHMIEVIKASCYPDEPLVISIIMPTRWRVRFIQTCRDHFKHVTIVRPSMYGEHWHGFFYCLKAPKAGFFANQLLEKVWIPDGPNTELAKRLAAKALAKEAEAPSLAAKGIRGGDAKRARHNEQAALLERLEGLGE